MASAVRDLLHLGEAAWEAMELEDALRFADQALALQPLLVEALDLRAHALSELGDFAAADEAFARLVKQCPQDPVYRLSAADVLIRQPGDDRDRIEEGLALIDAAWPRVEKDRELSLMAELLRGVGLNQLGEVHEALEALSRALDIDPEHHEARLEQALALFELGRFDQARATLERLTRECPDDPWAWHSLGLVTEQLGRDPESHFARARALDPDEFPPPVSLSAEDFDRAVQDAIAALPEHARPHLANAIIDVAPLPDADDLKDGVSPSVLGLFRGVPIDERSPLEPQHHETARITLFQKNLERFAATRAELLEQISVTVLHEVGHLLGLDEDELYERGLD